MQAWHHTALLDMLLHVPPTLPDFAYAISTETTFKLFYLGRALADLARANKYFVEMDKGHSAMPRDSLHAATQRAGQLLCRLRISLQCCQQPYVSRSGPLHVWLWRCTSTVCFIGRHRPKVMSNLYLAGKSCFLKIHALR